MTLTQAKFLMAAVILARSTSYIMSKFLMSDMGQFNVLSIRFLLASALLLILFHKRIMRTNKKILLKGMLLGGAFFAVMAAEMAGLKSTDSQTVSFLENTAIVFVPFIEAILVRRFPEKKILLCGLITLAGVGFLTLKNGHFALGIGEMFCILAAIFYALSIIITDRVAKNDDPMLLGIWQVVFMGIYSTIATFIFETPHLPQSGVEWAAILALALVCSGFGFALQPVAQKHISSETAGLFTGLNPLGAAIWGSLFLDERLGASGIIGAALIIVGMVLATINPPLKKTEKSN